MHEQNTNNTHDETELGYPFGMVTRIGIVTRIGMDIDTCDVAVALSGTGKFFTNGGPYH